MSNPENNSGISLTAKEVATLVSAFSTSEVTLKPNYEAMAEQVGYSNAKSASTMWGNLRRKLLGTANQRASGTLKRIGNNNNSPKKAYATKSAGDKPSPGKKQATMTTSRYLSPEGEDDDEEEVQLDYKVKVKEEENELDFAADDYIIWDD